MKWVDILLGRQSRSISAITSSSSRSAATETEQLHNEPKDDLSRTFTFHVLNIKGRRDEFNYLEQFRRFVEGYDVVTDGNCNFLKEFNPFCLASILPLRNKDVSVLSMVTLEKARMSRFGCPSNACGVKLREKECELTYTFCTFDLCPKPIFEELVRRFNGKVRITLDFWNDRLGVVGQMRVHNGKAHFREVNKFARKAA